MTTRNQEIDNALKSHDKAITEIQATLSALSKQQEGILKAVTEKTGSGSGEGGGSGSAFNTNGVDSRNNRSLRIGKIDFPKFSGDDVEGWVYRCEHFNAMDETPEGMKLRYAVVHLEGDALQWHRAYLRTRNATVAEIQWDEYVNLTESQAISLYLNALSPDIRGMVKMFRPRTLHGAYGLAKTQALNNESLEEKINKGNGNSGNTRNYSNFNITLPVNASKLPLLPTPNPAKTTFTKPNGGPLYVIEMEDEDDEETEEIGAETEEKEHQISIHALTGLPSYSTMRMTMKFEVDGKQYEIKGLQNNNVSVCLAEKVEELLEVFQTPKGLPPTRPFDHRIVLKEGTLPISQRPYRGVLVFFDDILVYNRRKDDHIQHLNRVLTTMKKNKLFAKESKCVFGGRSVEYLGHIISEEGVKTDPKKIEVVQQWPVPKTIKQLRGFLRLANNYRRFIRFYGMIAKPLTDLLKKDAFKWSEEAQTAFDKLKEALTSAHVLALPDPTKQFILETDASAGGLGAVLMQERHPVSFFSRAISLRQSAMSVYEKELLAIMMAHKWLAKLMGYNYVIEYKKGRENVAADALSRVQGTTLFTTAISHIEPLLLDRIMKSQNKDVEVQHVIQNLKNGEILPRNPSNVVSTLEQEAILKAVTEKTGSGSGEGGGSGSAFNTNGADSRNNRSLRIGKIDFPKFLGDDVEGWVYRCEHFFAMDETPEGMKLRSISARFSNAMFVDPLEELTSLNQTGTLHDLNTAFDVLLNKVNLTESQAISLYLKALSPDIRGMVNMFRPRTLHEAYGLAKTQALNNESLEEKINKGKGNSRNTRNYRNFNIIPPVNASKLPLLPTPNPAKTTFTKPNGGSSRLTSKELEYKRAKGECFWCTEKFVPGHKYYVIDMEDEDDEETEEIGAETEEKEHQISIHALTGRSSLILNYAEEGVKTDPNKIEAVQQWPVPKTIKQLRGFLGLAGYYRRFISFYGMIEKPLTDLLKKDAFKWSEEAQTTFDKLKEALTFAPVLAFPDPTKQFILEKDASAGGFGAVLMQEHHPVSFFSRVISPRQSAMSIYKKELLAIMMAVTTPLQHKWLAKLMGYNYVIEYKKGRENVAADTLSRVQGTTLFTTAISHIEPLLLDRIIESQNKDVEVQHVIQKLKNGEILPRFKWNRKWLVKENHMVVGGSAELRDEIVKLCHESPMGDHLGVNAMVQRVYYNHYRYPMAFFAIFPWTLLEDYPRGIIQKNGSLSSSWHSSSLTLSETRI
nr:hypothetical protein [Tanacetum cinerariifolium]